MKNYLQHQAKIVSDLARLSTVGVWVANGREYGIEHMVQGYAVEAFVAIDSVEEAEEIKIFFNPDINQIDSREYDISALFVEPPASIDLATATVEELEAELERYLEEGSIAWQDDLHDGATTEELNALQAHIDKHANNIRISIAAKKGEN